MTVVTRLSVVCALLPLLAACGGGDGPPERFGSEETRLFAQEVIDGRRGFEDAIVGQTLRGDGVEVTVLPDGVLVGTALGRPFVGSWEHRRGVLCTSLSEPSPRRADDRRCYRAAVDGRAVTLAPLADG